MFKLVPFISALAGISVTQIVTSKESFIRITGFRTYYFIKEMEALYRTSRISKYMFRKVSPGYVEIPSFFALEFDKVLSEMRSRGHTSVRWTAMRVQSALRNSSWIKDIDIAPEAVPKTLNLAHLRKFKYQPLDYQQKFLQEYDHLTYRLKLNGVLLDAVMGSGKTNMALYLAECCEAEKVVVLCQKNSIHNVWSKTVVEQITPAPSIWTTESGRPYRGEKYLIVHFEALGDATELVTELGKKHKLCVIADECHHFNELNTKRTQEMIAIFKGSRTRHGILQSGTMFKAIGAEIVAAMYAIDPTFDEDLAGRFKRLYSASATEVLTLLRYRLGFFTYKVVKEQVGLGAPETEVLMVTTPDAYKYTLAEVSKAMKEFIAERVAYYDSRKDSDYSQYERITRNFAKQLRLPEEIEGYRHYQGDVAIIRRGDLMNSREEIKASNDYERRYIIPTLSPDDKKIFEEVKTIYKYVVLKIQGECLGKVLGRFRIDACISIAKAFNYSKYIESTEKKTLVYTNYVESLQAAKDTLENLGYETATAYGATNKDIDATIKLFESKPEINPLLATFKSLSTAVPLTMADVLIMLDVPFRDYVAQQTIARIHRLGKDTQTRVYICKLDTGTEPNISGRTLDILQWSQAQIEAITGVKPPFAIDEKTIAVESSVRLREPLDIVDGRLEEVFMKPLT